VILKPPCVACVSASPSSLFTNRFLPASVSRFTVSPPAVEFLIPLFLLALSSPVLVAFSITSFSFVVSVPLAATSCGFSSMRSVVPACDFSFSGVLSVAFLFWPGWTKTFAAFDAATPRVLPALLLALAFAFFAAGARLALFFVPSSCSSVFAVIFSAPPADADYSQRSTRHPHRIAQDLDSEGIFLSTLVSMYLCFPLVRPFIPERVY
jgi:hypothetical protein